MGIFKRLAALEEQNAKLSLALAAQKDAFDDFKDTVEAAFPLLHEQSKEIERFEEGVNNILLFDAGIGGGS